MEEEEEVMDEKESEVEGLSEEGTTKSPTKVTTV